MNYKYELGKTYNWESSSGIVSKMKILSRRLDRDLNYYLIVFFITKECPRWVEGPMWASEPLIDIHIVKVV